MRKRKICVVTGSRADYGLLYWVMKEIAADSELEVQVAVTGMHLAPDFGMTVQTIEADGFRIDARIETLLAADTPASVTKSIGLGVIGFADALDRLRPDLILLLGDRFEILAAAQAALVRRVPIAHIAGGDVTEGAFDDTMRHCITKMAQLHFVTNEVSARRVRQLGENPEHVYNVGSPGLDHIDRTRLLSRQELEDVLGFRLREKNLVVTFHPVTLEPDGATAQFAELLEALDRMGPEVGLLFTRPNADPGRHELARLLDDFVQRHAHAKVFISLGQRAYLSAVAHSDAVVGNSSSGLYEVPSLKKPTVNIGDRQKGRVLASSVVSCAPDAASIWAAIQMALAMDCSRAVNPYGDGRASARIVRCLKSVPDWSALLKKRFFDTSPT